MRSSTSFALRAGVVAFALGWIFAHGAHASESPVQFFIGQQPQSYAMHGTIRIWRKRHRVWREQTVSRPNPVSIFAGDVLREASRFIGPRNPTGFNGPYCKAFTNFVLRRVGFHPGPSLMAIDALHDGQRVAEPHPGDLAVMRGHVTFFARWDGPNAFVGLGGNQQHHRVALSRFSRSAVIAWVEPR